MEVWAQKQIPFELGIKKGKLRSRGNNWLCHRSSHRQGPQTQEKQKKKNPNRPDTAQTSSPEAGRGPREWQSSKYRQADNPESKMVTGRYQNRQQR